MGAGKTSAGGYPPPVGTVPMLTRVPAGELMDSPRRAPVRRAAEVLYSDTSWRPCLIVAWARYRGGWAALIRWPDGREDWRQFNRRHMRPQVSALRACPALPSGAPAPGRPSQGRSSRGSARVICLLPRRRRTHLRVRRHPGRDPVMDQRAAGGILGWRIGHTLARGDRPPVPGLFGKRVAP